MLTDAARISVKREPIAALKVNFGIVLRAVRYCDGAVWWWNRLSTITLNKTDLF